jgi:hypothetical protein
MEARMSSDPYEANVINWAKAFYRGKVAVNISNATRAHREKMLLLAVRELLEKEEADRRSMSLAELRAMKATKVRRRIERAFTSKKGATRTKRKRDKLTWCVQVIETKLGKVVRTLSYDSEPKALRGQRGVEINLDRSKYHTLMTWSRQKARPRRGT